MMNYEERKAKLEQFIKNTRQHIKKLSLKIDELSKTKKAQKENKEKILELYEDIGIWETTLDAYYFIGHELEIF